MKEQTKNNKKVCEAPSGNTGLLNTTKVATNAVVDWLSVTLKNVCEITEIYELFSLSKDDFELRDYGRKFYKKSAVCDGISIYYDGSKPSMGVNIEMTGQGCRQYENLFDDTFSWHNVFKSIDDFGNYNVTRLDLAIDDYKEQLKISRLVNLLENGCVLAGRTKTASYIKTVNLEDGSNAGTTFYLGKKEWKLRFYEKKHERIAKGFEVTHDSWNRYEVQFMSHTAKNMMVYLLQGVPVGVALKEFLNAKVSFKVKNKSDSNRSRWKNQPFWDKFLDDVGTIDFIKKEREYSVERSMRWFDNQVSGTFYMLQQSIDPYLMKEYFTKVGKDKMSIIKQKAVQDFKNDSEAVLAVERHMKNYLNVEHNDQMIIDNRIQMSDYFDKTKEKRENKIKELKAKKEYDLQKELLADIKRIRENEKSTKKRDISAKDAQKLLFENILDTYK